MSYKDDIEIIIENDITIFDWNNEDIIQPMCEELGEPEFSDPRPCG